MIEFEASKIGKGAINLVEETLKDNHMSGKKLYVAEAYVDQLYGAGVRS